MASDTTTSDVLLTGQTAYVKAQGTMVNHGTIEIPDGNTLHSYGKGYVGPNSIIHGTPLEDIAEYKNCETDMKAYLGENWEEDPEEYTLITNANKVANMLKTDELYIQHLQELVSFDGSELTNIYTVTNTATKPVTSMIDLGINANQVYGLEFTFNPYNTTTTTYDNCSYLSGVLDNFTIGKHGNTSSEIYLRHRGEEKFTNGSVTASATSVPSTWNTVKILNGQVLVNGTQKATVDPTLPIASSSGNLMLFSNASFTRGAVMYFHELKLYAKDQTTLLAHFIPAITSVGDIGVYDKIRKKFYHNLGTDPFSYGYKIHEYHLDLEYVVKPKSTCIIPHGDSTGTADFNMYYPNNFNGFEFEFMPLEDFTVAEGNIIDKCLFQIVSDLSTSVLSSSYGTNYISICSANGYSNGIINLDTSSTEPSNFIDAKMIQNERQIISYKNGILTLPDGSTQSLTLSGSKFGIRIGGRLEGTKKETYSNYSKLRFYSLKLYNNDTLVGTIIPIEDHNGICQIYNETYDRIETTYTDNTLKPGPIKIN